MAIEDTYRSGFEQGFRAIRGRNPALPAVPAQPATPAGKTFSGRDFEGHRSGGCRYRRLTKSKRPQVSLGPLERKASPAFNRVPA